MVCVLEVILRQTNDVIEAVAQKMEQGAALKGNRKAREDSSLALLYAFGKEEMDLELLRRCV